MSAGLAFQPLEALDGLIARVVAAAASPDVPSPRLVAEALQDDLGDPSLLDGVDCPGCPESYVRHILYACPKGRFSLMALVWMPGQASPLHAHRAWCALGVHSGVLTESFYTPRPAAPPAWVSDHRREAGDLSFGPANDDAIHCLANRSARPAISLHVYGLPPDRLCSDLNRVYVA